MNPQGNFVTGIGFVGVISTFIIMVVAYKQYWNSPYRK